MSDKLVDEIAVHRKQHVNVRQRAGHGAVQGSPVAEFPMSDRLADNGA